MHRLSLSSLLQKEFWLHTAPVCNTPAYRTFSKANDDFQRVAYSDISQMRLRRSISPPQHVPKGCRSAAGCMAPNSCPPGSRGLPASGDAAWLEVLGFIRIRERSSTDHQ